jgi:hypothetical protein
MHVMPFEVTPYSILNFLQLAVKQKGGLRWLRDAEDDLRDLEEWRQ